MSGFKATRQGLSVCLAILLIVLMGRLWSGGYLDRDPMWRYAAKAPAAPLSILLFSGDAGMRRGMGPYLARYAADHGIQTTAISTSTVFRAGVDRQKLDAIVADAIRSAEAVAGAGRLIVIGQSYGADILQTGLAHLPAALRPGIARIILIVPGTGTYYRADPTGLLYYFTPSSRSIETASTLRWAPLSCIYGREDDDNLCALLHLPNATVVGLPGNHYLDHDKPRLAGTVMREIQRPAAVR